jgi:hypothetical protein
MFQMKVAHNSSQWVVHLMSVFIRLDSWRKGKIVPLLFLTEHHAVKAYWGSGCIAPRILNVGTRCKWIDNDKRLIWAAISSRVYIGPIKGKGETVPVLFNWAPHHEGVLWEWKYTPTHFWPRHLTEVCGQLHTPAALPPGKEPFYPLDRRLSGPQSRSGRGSEENSFQPVPGLEPPIIQPVAQRYTTELSRLFILDRYASNLNSPSTFIQ